MCVCVLSSQRKVFRLWCSCGLFRPEASLQTDPAPWFQSSHLLVLSRSGNPTFHPSWCLFSLPVRWLWSHSPEDGGPERTLHESRPATFPVWCLRASAGWGECVATEHHEEHHWYGHGGRKALHQPQVVANAVTTAADRHRGYNLPMRIAV